MTQPIVAEAVKLAITGLKDISVNDIDCMAIILNDFNGSDEYSAELWVNLKKQVEAAISKGIRNMQARWLYENWGRDCVTIQLIGDDVSDYGDLKAWRESVSWEGYYETGVEVARELRALVTGLHMTPILVDNNHDYEEIVFKAIRAANSDGQAEDWFQFPPPDCDRNLT